MNVVVEGAAASFVTARGGEIYLWVDKGGLVHVRATPPADVAEWEQFVSGEVDVFVAPSAQAVESWRVSLVRFPWRRLMAASELTGGLGQDPSGGIGSGVW